MGQHEVLMWLAHEHKFDKNKFFTVKEIACGLKKKNPALNGNAEQIVRRSLKKLLDWGQVEVDFENDWRRAYRFNA